MYKKILVPIDLGDDNLEAVKVAAELACLQPDGVVVLLHVIETIEDAPEEEVRDFYASLEEQARRTMEAIVDALDRKPSMIERRVEYGRRLQGILDTATAIGADLGVLRSHRMRPEQPGGGVGTLSHEVALLAEIPVLLVR
jgi:nucleotide-binding universal stress UspA family protein